MENFTSWKELFIVIGIAIGIYLLCRFIRIYWDGFIDRLNERMEVYESDLLSTPKDDPESKKDGLKALQILLNKIRYTILEKAGKTATKDQLLEAISEKVASYDGLHHPAFRYALNNYIIQHCEKICGVKVEEEELEALWIDLPRKTKTQ